MRHLCVTVLATPRFLTVRTGCLHGRLEAISKACYPCPIGPPATITREPGQIRKEAATAGTLCAGVWLVGLPPIIQVIDY